MSGRTTCKICGKSFARFTVHLRSKHNMSLKEYNDKFGEEKEEIVGNEFPKEEDNEYTSSNDDLLLSEFLEEYGMSEEGLRRILDNRMRRGTPRTEAQVMNQIAKNQEYASRQVAKLKDKDEVKTTDLLVAELLTTHYGFTCVAVVAAQEDGTPKYWHLKK